MHPYQRSKDDFIEPNEAEYDVNCYADGSKINELAGAGIVIKGIPQVVNLNYNESFHFGQSFRVKWKKRYFSFR